MQTRRRQELNRNSVAITYAPESNVRSVATIIQWCLTQQHFFSNNFDKSQIPDYCHRPNYGFDDDLHVFVLNNVPDMNISVGFVYKCFDR